MSYSNEYYGPITNGQYHNQKKHFQQNSPFYVNGQRPKRSGFKIINSYGSEKGLFMVGWKKTKQGIARVKVFRDKYQKEIAPKKSKTGKKWCSVRVIVNRVMQDTISVQGLMNVDNHKVYIEDWNWILNPNANNGGYIGKRFSKKK